MSFGPINVENFGLIYVYGIDEKDRIENVQQLFLKPGIFILGFKQKSNNLNKEFEDLSSKFKKEKYCIGTLSDYKTEYLNILATRYELMNTRPVIKYKYYSFLSRYQNELLALTEFYHNNKIKNILLKPLPIMDYDLNLQQPFSDLLDEYAKKPLLEIYNQYYIVNPEDIKMEDYLLYIRALERFINR